MQFANCLCGRQCPRALLWLLGASLSWFASAQPSSIPREDFWLPSRSGTQPFIQALVVRRDTLYLGGAFDAVVPAPPVSGTMLDLFSAQQNAGFPRVQGRIVSILPDGEGGWFVGGEFLTIGGAQRMHLAHIRADLTLDSNWNPQPDGPIGAMAILGRTLYLAGVFARIQGQARPGLAAVDAVTGELSGWQSTLNGGWARTLAARGDRVYVGGNFKETDGKPRRALAALDAQTGQVLDWAPRIEGDSDAEVFAVVVLGTTVYASGYFNTVNGEPRSSLVALDETTASTLPWNPSASLGFGTPIIYKVLPYCDRI